MKVFAEYAVWITIFCLMINFMIGKLQLISLIWLYGMQKKREPNLGLSVIICTHNDLENLQHNLNSILHQDYPQFEVIVVNDASNDGTKEYLNDLQLKYSHLRIVELEEKKSSGKKEALKKGIENAQFPFVVLTDADCSPTSNQWLRHYAKYAGPEKTVVLGYGKYEKKNGFINTFIRFDTVKIAMQYMSKALWKYPYMGVGRNMGYSKDLLTAHAQINSELASGDDDLFVQAVSGRSKFYILLEKESHTVSKPKEKWKDWLNQKGRHTTTAPKYSLFTKIGLLFRWLVNITFYTGIICILLTGDLQTGLMLFLLNLLCLGLFNGLWISRLGEKDLILSAPFLDFIYTFVQPIFVLKTLGRKKDRWN